MRRTFGLASDGLCLRACGLGRGARAESQPLPTPATMPSASRAITLRGPSQTAWWVSKPWAGLLRARDCTSHLDTSRACSRPPPSSNLRAGIRGRQGLQGCLARKQVAQVARKKIWVISVRAWSQERCLPSCVLGRSARAKTSARPCTRDTMACISRAIILRGPPWTAWCVRHPLPGCALATASGSNTHAVATAACSVPE